MCQTLLTLLNTLSRISNYGNQVVGGARQRITEALDDLHTSEKAVENNEQLLVSHITLFILDSSISSKLFSLEVQ
jgi:hypothetical protein